jgi:hypothetical protein
VFDELGLAWRLGRDRSQGTGHTPGESTPERLQIIRSYARTVWDYARTLHYLELGLQKKHVFLTTEVCVSQRHFPVFVFLIAEVCGSIADILK